MPDASDNLLNKDVANDVKLGLEGLNSQGKTIGKRPAGMEDLANIFLFQLHMGFNWLQL